MIIASIVTTDDDLEELVNKIHQANWDDANGVSGYSVQSLAAYLARQDTIFVACRDTMGPHPIFLGIASARLELKPYAKQTWLYVDEVDVCVGQRRKGAGRAMMKVLFGFAETQGCDFVWLGTEVDNEPANALYRSLGPADVAGVQGYTYSIGK